MNLSSQSFVNSPEFLLSPTTEGKIRSEYPLVIACIYSDTLNQLREDNKPIVGKLWALQALEMSVGRAMGHLIIIGSDETLKESRHAMYPVEYMDKSIGVKFGRALACGLTK